MNCPKCDYNFDGEHCHFCGFVPTRHPTSKEKKETRAPYSKYGTVNSTSYSYDDYTIKQIKQERCIWEVR